MYIYISMTLFECQQTLMSLNTSEMKMHNDDITS